MNISIKEWIMIHFYQVGWFCPFWSMYQMKSGLYHVSAIQTSVSLHVWVAYFTRQQRRRRKKNTLSLCIFSFLSYLEQFTSWKFITFNTSVMFFFAFSQNKKHLSQNFVGRKWNWEYVIWVGNPMRKYLVEMSYSFSYLFTKVTRILTMTHEKCSVPSERPQNLINI